MDGKEAAAGDPADGPSPSCSPAALPLRADPGVFRGLAVSAVSRITPRRLQEALGSEPFPVGRDLVTFSRAWQSALEAEEAEGEGTPGVIYLRAADIHRSGGDFVRSVDETVAPVFPPGTRRRHFLFAGGRGCCTGLHWDESDVVITGVEGRKQVRWAAPSFCGGQPELASPP